MKTPAQRTRAKKKKALPTSDTDDLSRSAMIEDDEPRARPVRLPSPELPMHPRLALFRALNALFFLVTLAQGGLAVVVCASVVRRRQIAPDGLVALSAIALSGTFAGFVALHDRFTKQGRLIAMPGIAPASMAMFMQLRTAAVRDAMATLLLALVITFAHYWRGC